VIPFVTDIPEILGPTLKDLYNCGAEYVLFGGMTLKRGKQENYFMNILNHYAEELELAYHHLYQGDRWGNAIQEYYQSLYELFDILIKRFPIPTYIKPQFYHNVLTDNQRAIVVLQQLDFFHRSRGRKNPYGYASYVLSKQKQPLWQIRKNLRSINGIGPKTAQIIYQILDHPQHDVIADHFRS